MPVDEPDAGEEVADAAGAASCTPSTSSRPRRTPRGACDAAHKCSWDLDDRGELAGQPRAERRPGLLLRQSLPRPPVRRADLLQASDGNFEDGDRILVNTDDGASHRPRRRSPGQRVHGHAAQRHDPDDGDVPVLQDRQQPVPRRQRRRRRRDRLPRVHPRPLQSPRDHEPGRRGALNGGAGGRDGRGLERLVREGLPGRPVPRRRHGRRGRGPHGQLHRLGSPLDPHAGARLPGGRGRDRSCPGDGLAGAGGYTYGDFGRIFGGPEVHADGEIWAETLWDLRAAVGRRSPARSSPRACALPPEPTFLDMRDAILAPTAQLFPEATTVGRSGPAFAGRGMGSDAAEPDAGHGLGGIQAPARRGAGRVALAGDRGPAGQLRRLAPRPTTAASSPTTSTSWATGPGDPRDDEPETVVQLSGRGHVPSAASPCRTTRARRYRRQGAGGGGRADRRRPRRRRPRRGEPAADDRPRRTGTGAACASRSAATPRAPAPRS